MLASFSRWVLIPRHQILTMLSYPQKHEDRGCQGVHIRHNGAPCREYPIRIWRTGRQRNTWHEAEDHRHPVLFHLLVVPLQPGLFYRRLDQPAHSNLN